MRVLIAPDSFKEALSANEVAQAIARGLHAASPLFTTTCLPVADGGEGTSRILCEALQGQWVETSTVDALLRPRKGGYAWFPERQLAVVELAESAGLHKLTAAERNPLHTSTFGVGLLIADALKRGAREAVLTLGGSATNDAGSGMAAALGWKFYADNENLPHPTGADLKRITRIEAPKEDTPFTCTVLCDVDNPLLGGRGAARTFSPQKGATPESVELLERGAASFACVVSSFLPKGIPEGVEVLEELPGTGAAGGTAFGAVAFLGASIKRGAPEVLRLLQFDAHLDTCDLLITGEGCLDHQTAGGKLIASAAAMAHRRGIPVIAICGMLKLEDVQALDAMGITSAFPLGNGTRPLHEALASTAADLERVACQVGRTLVAGSHIKPRI